MQTTENVLKVLSERGKKHQTVERLHRQLYNIELYKAAYGQIYNNRGAITRGVDDDTLDGTSLKTFENIIKKVKSGTYRWKPSRRTYIAKKDGKRRPLGIPVGNDKLLQTAMKLLLEAYYDPQFSERSHGFRRGRGCQTALIAAKGKLAGAKWFVEGDIKGAFDNIDHKILMEILAEDIKDDRFLKLIKNLLKAGYMKNWTTYDTHSGTPQGGVISPLLANIYLHKFDKWVEKELLPRYTRSHKERGLRRANKIYRHYERKAYTARKNGDAENSIRWRKEMKKHPSVDMYDPEYRKLEYIRYADDFILGFAGPKSEALEIKESIRTFLRDELELELSQEKTLITHAETEKAKFLGYDLKMMRSKGNNRKSVNGFLWYGIPYEVIQENIQKYTRKGKVWHRPYMIAENEYDIIRNYQAEFRGLYNYYCMAHNLKTLGKVNHVAQTSLLKTLANKYKSTVKKMWRKYKAEKTIKGTTYVVYQKVIERDGKKPLVAFYGGPRKRNPTPAHINDSLYQGFGRRYEIISKLEAELCQMCGLEGPVEMHHREPMKNVHRKGTKSLSAWDEKMIAMNRITIPVCWNCHRAITYGKHLPEWDKYKAEFAQS
jgi:group II intron reverse transcriptase/maturase